MDHLTFGSYNQVVDAGEKVIDVETSHEVRPNIYISLTLIIIRTFR